jgi:hypothetical protein
MDGAGCAGAAGAADHALVPVAEEHGLADALPGAGRVAAVAHAVRMPDCAPASSAQPRGRFLTPAAPRPVPIIY